MRKTNMLGLLAVLVLLTSPAVAAPYGGSNSGEAYGWPSHIGQKYR